MHDTLFCMRMSNCHPDRRHMAHGLCGNCYYKDRYKKFPELLKRRNATPAAKARKRRWHLKQAPGYVISNHRKRRYGLSDQAFNEMLQRQDHRCKICLRKFPQDRPKAIHIDHNHTTNKVRALLCRGCNTGLGMLRESEFILARMIAYLRWSESIQPEIEPWAFANFVDLPGPDVQPSTFAQSSSPE